MHSSGTSFLARALSKMGLFMGDVDRTPSTTHSNGTYENRRLYSGIDDFLTERGGSWSNIPNPMPEPNTTIRETIRCIVEELRDHGKPAGIKDPRLTMLVRPWRSLFPSDIKIAGIFRSPWAVARNFEVHKEFSFYCALALWETYNIELMRLADEHGATLFNFDDDPDKLCRSVTEFGKSIGLTECDTSDWYVGDHSQIPFALPEEVAILHQDLMKRAEF